MHCCVAARDSVGEGRRDDSSRTKLGSRDSSIKEVARAFVLFSVPRSDLQH